MEKIKKQKSHYFLAKHKFYDCEICLTEYLRPWVSYLSYLHCTLLFYWHVLMFQLKIIYHLLSVAFLKLYLFGMLLPVRNYIMKNYDFFWSFVAHYLCDLLTSFNFFCRNNQKLVSCLLFDEKSKQLQACSGFFTI